MVFCMKQRACIVPLSIYRYGSIDRSIDRYDDDDDDDTLHFCVIQIAIMYQIKIRRYFTKEYQHV